MSTSVLVGLRDSYYFASVRRQTGLAVCNGNGLQFQTYDIGDSSNKTSTVNGANGLLLPSDIHDLTAPAVSFANETDPRGMQRRQRLP